MATVARHMSRDLLTVQPQVALAEAAQAMHGRGVGAVLVLEEGRLVGILTERDMLRAVATGHEPNEPVAEWMTHHPETIESSDTTEHAGVLMIHGGFRHLPVVDEGELVGILSLRDLMRVVLEDSAPRGP
jgi:CBS domain-containing protein